MTTGSPQRSVLVFGKSQLMLDDIVAALHDAGYTALATNDFFSDITGQFNVTGIDLVVFGRQVPRDRQAELREEIGAINSRVIFLEGVGGIPGLVINRVQEAFAAGH
jgi:hypothetical protein